MSLTKKYWFLQSVMEKGRMRMKVLPSQTITVEGVSGTKSEEIDESWNVQCDKELRTRCPINTIFITDVLEKKSSFYQAGSLWTLTKLPDVPHADDEMLDAYKDYEAGRYTGAGASSPPPKTSAGPKRATLYDKMVKDPDLKVPDIKDGFYVPDDTWYFLVRNIQQKQATMLIGQTGTGKTEIVRLICEKLGLPLQIFDMGSMYDAVSGLLGVHRLEAGKSVFDYAKFTEVIQKPGVVLLDELSRAPVTTNNILFPCLDYRRSLPVEMAGCKDLRDIKIHPECTFIATANLGGEYTGTNTLDRALLDRFQLIEMTYMDLATEKKVLENKIKVGTTEAHIICTIAQSVRNLYAKGELSTFISTRHTLQVAELVKDGFQLHKAAEMILLPLFEGTRAEGERSQVVKLLMSK